MTSEKLAEGAALFSAKRFFDAVQVYAGVADSPAATPEEKARAFGNISACYASTKDFEKALASAERAVELQPGNAKFLGRVATAHEGLSHYEEAADFFGRAQQLDPASAVYRDGAARVRGLMQARRGVASTETKERYYYAKSLEKGKAAMTSGNYREAVRHFGKALELFPGGEGGDPRELAILYANRSAAHFRAGGIDESANDADAAIEADGTYARGFFRLACARQRLKQFGPSLDALQSCLRLEPGHAEATRMLPEVEPEARRERQTASERAAEAAAKVAELQEKQVGEQAEADAQVVAGRRAHAYSYAYCSYCNETGHTRGECPLRRKRPRF